MSEFRTPEPMSERRRTYMRLIAEVGVSIVGVVALALLGGPVVGILMPFILAFIMAWMFNPIIAWLPTSSCWCFTRCCSACACSSRGS